MASRRSKITAPAPVSVPAKAEPKRRGRKPKAAIVASQEFELTSKGETVVKAMAEVTKPAPSAIEKKSSILTGPVYASGDMYFTLADRLLYENKQLAVKNALQQIALKKFEIMQTKSAFEERMRKLDSELGSVTQDAKGMEKALYDLQVEISHVYRVDLQKIAYDPESGRITVAVI